MNVRVCLLFLFFAGLYQICIARMFSSEKEAPDLKAHKKEVCATCEQYTMEALHFFKENKTRNDINEFLHTACSQLPLYKEECISLVDYYASIFFSEIDSVKPEDICHRLDLCKQPAAVSKDVHEDKCESCHHAVAEVLVKLEDPDTQLEILEMLLKGCKSMKEYTKKCKRMVLEYGPIMLSNAEKFLKETDVCTILHACNPPTLGYTLSTLSGVTPDLAIH